MPEAVICNSSCLIILEGVGMLEILRKLYGEITIPEAVREEFGAELPSWIRVERAESEKAFKMLLIDLGKGEAEAIALAIERKRSTLVLDDKKARGMAAELGLKFTGTLGILIKAKREGLVVELRPLLEEIARKNFRISKALEEKALVLAGEG